MLQPSFSLLVEWLLLHFLTLCICLLVRGSRDCPFSQFSDGSGLTGFTRINCALVPILLFFCPCAQEASPRSESALGLGIAQPSISHTHLPALFLAMLRVL